MSNVRHTRNTAGEVTRTFGLETRATNSGTLNKYEMSHSILPYYVDSKTFIKKIQQHEKTEIKIKTSKHKNKNIK
jgi:hypothetical protein